LQRPLLEKSIAIHDENALQSGTLRFLDTKSIWKLANFIDNLNWLD